MSPEQAAADSHIDHRADIYAVGVVAYELLTGRTPFLGTTAQMILSAHITDTPESVTKYRESVPPALEQLVMKCLEKKAADRWQTAEELLPQLEALVTPSGGITPTGTMPVDRVTRRRWMMLGGAVAVAALIAVIAVVAAIPRESGVLLDPNRVVVAVLRNETGDPSLDAVGRQAGHWITQGLQQTGIVQVTPWETALQSSRYVQAEAGARRVHDPVRALAEETGAGVVISGAYYLAGGDIQVQVDVTNAAQGRLLRSLDLVSGPRESPNEAIGELRRRVMGFLAVWFDERLAASANLSGEPPTIEAYQAFDEGMERYIRDDNKESLAYFYRALELDSTWLSPLLFVVINHHNVDELHLADSMLRVMETRSGQLTPYQRAWMEYWRANFDGDPEGALAAIRRAAEMAPGSKAVYNYAYMAYKRNRPQEALDALSTLDPERGPMRGLVWHGVFLSYALERLGEYDRALEEARSVHRLHPDRGALVLHLQARALAALGRTDELNDVLSEVETVLDPSSVTRPLMGSPLQSVHRALVVSVEALRAYGYGGAARDVLSRVLAWFEARPRGEATGVSHRAWYGRALFLAGRHEEAQGIFDALVDEVADTLMLHLELRQTRAFIAATRGDSGQAARDAEWFEGLDRPVLRGYHTFSRAVIAAALGDREGAVGLLHQALGQGLAFDIRWFRGLEPASLELDPLRDYPPFQELIRPKG
jgi:tetratricopeptide (TPR) repeat protein